MVKPPIPAPASAESFDAEGGIRLYAAISGPGARGVVWFVMGPEISANEPYPRLIAALHAADFATAVMHPRGTGYSDGLRGDIDDYTRFFADYRRFLERLAARFGSRIFLFGHSAGGSFALELAAGNTALAGVVVVNPAYKTLTARGMGPSLGDYVTYAANLLFRPAALTVDMNSHPSRVLYPADRAEAEAMQRDPLVVRYFSMRYLSAQRDLMNRCSRNAAALRAPFLLVAGAHDALVDPSGNQEVFQRVPVRDKQRLLAPDGGHGASAVETLVEPIVAWLTARAPLNHCSPNR